MAESAPTCPQVFVVDTHASTTMPPSSWRRRGAAPQWILVLLVTLALVGMVVEACFIYYLWNRPAVSDYGSSLRMSQDENEIEFRPTKKISHIVNPSKPSAHLTAHLTEGGIPTWGPQGDAFLYEMDTEDGQLIVRTEGYYFIYSKVFFKEPKCSIFKHAVQRRTPRYTGGDLELMKSKRFHCQGAVLSGELLNSYLGGVFHLYAGDAVFVTTENRTLVRYQDTTENFFGAFMI